jgi:hypothetical protein
MLRSVCDGRLLTDPQGNQRQFARPRAAAANSPYRRQLRVEPLEDRRLLATITVDTLVDGTGVPGTSLREAIAAAAASDTINFSVTGTINLISTGQLTINKNLTITGPGANLLTIQAYNPSPTAGNGSRVFNVDDGSSSSTKTVSISGLTLAGGDVTGTGGAIKSLENLTVTNCTISGSVATGTGSNGYGGGIFSSGHNLVVNSCTFSGNSARYGGGISCLNGSLTITGSTVSSNSATAGDGGGILSDTCPVTVTSCTISGNSATADGGGLFVDSTTATVTSSTISGNTAGDGGGGINSGYGTLTVTNSTISGNQAKINGGGIYADHTSVTVNHSTITANKADSDNNGSGAGGGLIEVSPSTKAYHHTIIAGNTKGTSTRSDASGAIELQYSLIGDSTGATVTNTGGNKIGTSAAPIDALLGPLANNGGPTLTHALLTGSPAIDAGNAAAVAGSGGVPQFDQRGTPNGRVVDGDGAGGARIDIGAFELLPVSNHSPTNPVAVGLTAINEDTPNASNAGTLVSAVVTASGSTDSDGNTLGIAATAADNSHGQWQYSTNGGGAWLDLTSVSTASARLLAPAYLVRFAPSADFNSQISASPTIGFKVWDQTSGTAGSTADTTSNSAYSASAAQATQPVTAVNDTPSFTLPATLVQRNEDAGAVSVSSFATNIARGPATATDEAAQTLTFLVTVTGTTGNLAFTTAPAINSATGALTFTTDANTNGTATVEVALQDGGSGTSPNVNTSAVQQFSIEIAAVNDEQVLATNNPLTLDRGASAVITASFLETTDIDNANSELVYIVTSDPAHGTIKVSGTPVSQFTQQQIGAGLVSYQHDGTATLADSIGFTVDDGQGTASSGTFQITIQPFVGDYNANRTVDAADYVVWRKTLNTGPVPAYSGADGNGDTAVDQDDYVVWRANFGNAMPAGAESTAIVALDTVSGERLGTGSALSTTRQVITDILPSSAAASPSREIAAGAAIYSDDTNAQTPNQCHVVGMRLSSVVSPDVSTSHDALLAWLSSYSTSEHPEDGDTFGLRGDAQRTKSDTVMTLDLLDEIFA